MMDASYLGSPDDKPNKGTIRNTCAQTLATIKWMRENYKEVEGACIPRCSVYHHYLDFCQSNGYTMPVGPAAFGKLLRQEYPKLSTRRLGSRGQSKYHYDGIGVKETSPFYLKKTPTRFSPAGMILSLASKEKQRKLSLERGCIKPKFPRAQDFYFSSSGPLSSEKVAPFLLMYGAHCSRILDTFVNANFAEVCQCHHHFWNGIPQHFKTILESRLVAEIAAFSDVILYKAVEEILIPPTIQEISESLCRTTRTVVKNTALWLNNENTTAAIPDYIKRRKMKVLQDFLRRINRQLSFLRLARICRSSVLKKQQNCGTAQTMVDDLRSLSLNDAIAQISRINGDSLGKCEKEFQHHISRLCQLLEKQGGPTLENLTEWMDKMIEDKLPKKVEATGSNTQRWKSEISDFLLRWTYLASTITNRLTLENASTFGSWHLMLSLVQEYLMMAAEEAMHTQDQLVSFQFLLQYAVHKDQMMSQLIGRATTLN